MDLPFSFLIAGWLKRWALSLPAAAACQLFLFLFFLFFALWKWVHKGSVKGNVFLTSPDRRLRFDGNLNIFFKF